MKKLIVLMAVFCLTASSTFCQDYNNEIGISFFKFIEDPSVGIGGQSYKEFQFPFVVAHPKNTRPLISAHNNTIPFPKIYYATPIYRNIMIRASFQYVRSQFTNYYSFTTPPSIYRESCTNELFISLGSQFLFLKKRKLSPYIFYDRYAEFIFAKYKLFNRQGDYKTTEARNFNDYSNFNLGFGLRYKFSSKFSLSTETVIAQESSSNVDRVARLSVNYHF